MSSLRAGGFTFVAWLAGIFLSASIAHADFKVPQLTGPVVDEAGVINGAQARELEAVLRTVRERGGPQINVVTVQTLGGESIEAASIKIADAWKIGGAKADDGVIFLIAMSERKLRIEVGQGLEGVLTDLESKRIISDQVTPFFRAGRSSDGIVAGVRGILAKAAPDQLKSLGDEPPEVPRAKRSRDRGLPWPVILGLFLLFAFFGRGGGGGGRGLLGAVLLSGMGSSGRSSGGGGSWSGGGGGFSGGGASGGW